MGKVVPAPSVKPASVPSRGRRLKADLYVPKGGGKHPALLIVHGVNPTGKDDEQIVLLAKNLARAGFLVLVPDFEGMKELRIRRYDVEDVVQSFLYLMREKNARPGGSMMGISYGAGPMLLAAADGRVSDRVATVVTFGGYADLRSVLRFSLTGSYEYGGHSGYQRPDSSLRWMFLYRNMDVLGPDVERDTLRKIIERRSRFETAEAAALAKTLGPEGRAVYAFLRNTEGPRFAVLYENLPVSLREYVHYLSPVRVVDRIKASFIIVHGMEDYSIPYTESLRLADTIGDPERVHVALLPQFMHIETVEPRAGNLYRRYMVGGWRLFSMIYEFLERNRL
jgi:dienelactone hydrolase